MSLKTKAMCCDFTGSKVLSVETGQYKTTLDCCIEKSGKTEMNKESNLARRKKERK